jgi:uncharacterized protein (TIGR00369 family)
MNETMKFLEDFSPLKGLDPLMEHLEILGAPVINAEWCELRLRLKDFHLNGGGTAHGGVFMTMLDVAMACSTWIDKSKTCVTVEMKANFLRPGGVAGELMIARGRKRSGGNSLAFCDAEVLNEAGDLLATGSGTFKYLDSGYPTRA